MFLTSWATGTLSHYITQPASTSSCQRVFCVGKYLVVPNRLNHKPRFGINQQASYASDSTFRFAQDFFRVLFVLRRAVHMKRSEIASSLLTLELGCQPSFARLSLQILVEEAGEEGEVAGEGGVWQLAYLV